MKFEEMVVHLPNEEAQEKYRRKGGKPPRTCLNPQQPKDIAEYQWRITTPLATLLLALIAVPLARSRPRESRFRNVTIAVLSYIALFAMISVLRTFIEAGPAWLRYPACGPRTSFRPPSF